MGDHHVTETDLEWLEERGHRVDRSETMLRDGRKYFRIDGIPTLEADIVSHITEGTPLGECRSCNKMVTPPYPKR